MYFLMPESDYEAADGDMTEPLRKGTLMPRLDFVADWLRDEHFHSGLDGRYVAWTFPSAMDRAEFGRLVNQLPDTLITIKEPPMLRVSLFGIEYDNEVPTYRPDGQVP
jgi:hypothetical protein